MAMASTVLLLILHFTNNNNNKCFQFYSLATMKTKLKFINIININI